MTYLSYFPLPSASLARGLVRTCEKKASLDYVDTHANALMQSWLGRRVIVQKFETYSLNSQEITKLWTRIWEASPSIEITWDLWKELSFRGVALKAQPSLLKMWQFQNIKTATHSTLRDIVHRIGVFIRLNFETIIFYFGFSPKLIFSARSLWDMEHRYMSLQRLAGIITTLAFSIYEARSFATSTAAWLGISQVLWAQVALTVVVAISTFALISATFNALRKVLKMAPAEVWHCRNLNHEALQGQFKPLSYCEEPIQTLSKILCSSSSAMAWIRGPAGMGKTYLVQELARRLTLDLLPKELGKPKIFFLNCADLSGSAFVNSVEKLQVIQEELDGFESQVVLVLDECHLLDKPSVEFIKSWKEKGLRLILISNSEDNAFRMAWGSETLASFKSHTNNSQIMLAPPCPKLLEGMIISATAQSPHVKITADASKHLVDAFKDKKGAPRLMKLLLDQWITQAHFQQHHTQELLKNANELEELSQELIAATKACEFEKASDITTHIETKHKERDQLMDHSDQLQAKISQIQIRTVQLNRLREYVCKASLDSVNNPYLVSMLTTLQPVMKQYQQKTQSYYQGDLSKFPFVWEFAHFKPLIATS